jgi:hypothetical protein
MLQQNFTWPFGLSMKDSFSWVSSYVVKGGVIKFCRNKAFVLRRPAHAWENQYTLPGTVEKIIKPIVPSELEKAQIAVEGADHLYKEIRIENTLTDERGDKVQLKPGAQVKLTVEARAGSNHGWRWKRPDGSSGLVIQINPHRKKVRPKSRTAAAFSARGAGDDHASRQSCDPPRQKPRFKHPSKTPRAALMAY